MTQPDRPFLSAVSPLYRTGDVLETLHRRLTASLDPLERPYELVFVADGCEDSRAAAEKVALRDRRVVLVPLEHNVGQHAAVRQGLRHARGEWVVVLDADLQDPPEAIPRLLAAAEPGDGAVFAGRRGRYESRLRLLTSRAFKRLNHLVAGVPPDAGLFVLMRRPLVDRLLALDGPPEAIVSMIGLAGFPTRSVPVQREPRLVGRSSHTSPDRVAVAARALGWAIRARLR